MLNSSPKVLQVFVSSTFLDLQAEHHAAIAGILTSGHRPAGVGQFTLSANPIFSMRSIEQWIDQCDVYVLILGRFYGLPTAAGKSWVHLEYDYAVAQEKPIIAFLMDESAMQMRDGPGRVEIEHADQLYQLRQQAQTHQPHYWTAVTDIEQTLIARLSDLTQPESPQLDSIDESAASSAAFSTATPITIEEEALSITLYTIQGLAQAIQDVAAATQAAQHITDQALMVALEGETSAQAAAIGVNQLKIQVVESARTAKQITESAQQLSKVVTLVSQIASRINVIALNASLEVSRMGVRGEGFVSVAHDMRQLAQHTAKVGEAVAKLIEPLQTRANLVMATLAEGVQSAIATTPPVNQTQTAFTQLSQISEQLSQLNRMLIKAVTIQIDTSSHINEVLQSLEDRPPPSGTQVAHALQALVTLQSSEQGIEEPF
jgi:nucleoside 2-deoxyribosyltransferase